MPPGNRTILLVDDDSDDLEMLDEAFQRIEPQIEIWKASSGEEAVAILQSPPQQIIPELMVLDFNMPDLTGAEVLASISQDQRYSRIPKVIWSTSNSKLYEDLCRANGATHYFIKPHSIEEIFVLAKNILELTKGT